MANINHQISLYDINYFPTNEERQTGANALFTTSVSAPSETEITHAFSSLSADTWYALEWAAEDAANDWAYGNRVEFKTEATPSPVAPKDATRTSYNGSTVRFDASVGWTNADPNGFSASSLPTGLSISAQGLVTGTPTANGQYATTITNTNAYGSDTQKITWNTIDAPPPSEGDGANGLSLNLRLRI